MPNPRSEFRNTKPHTIGVVVRSSDNKMKGIALGPNETVWLDEDEQMETANAPRDPGDNPFINGDLELVTPATMIANRRPIGFTEHPQVPGEGEEEAAEPESPEAGLAGDGETGAEGSQEPAAPEAGADAGGDAPKAAEEPPAPAEAPEDPAATKRSLTAAEKEENARQAAARAVKGGAPRQGNETGAAPKTPPAAPAEGSRAAGEEIATPEAAGK